MLKAGEGTLIVEHRTPKGPIREWWTEDDLVAASPVRLPVCVTSPPDEDRLQARVVRRALLFAGDAESVFLASGEPDAG
jgi:hypothetical protein